MCEQDRSDQKGEQRLPPWLRTRFEGGRTRRTVRQLLRELRLHTVCESARCPNLCECWSRRAATFLLLGAHCTRDCRFCAVAHGSPSSLDAEEPARICAAVARLGLRFVVLTCVTRDDLADGGAGHIAAVITQLRAADSDLGIEVLPSDFGGRLASVETVLRSGPDVFNHNVETVRRLTEKVRDPRADYDCSFGVLRHARELAVDLPRAVRVKSGMMLGMGETAAEIHDTLRDLSEAGVQIVTLGQYLPPSSTHWPLDRYVEPAEFDEWRRIGETEYGFDRVVSGPLVRSSYLAEDAAESVAASDAKRGDWDEDI